MYLRKEDGVTRIIALMEEGEGYVPAVLKVKGSKNTGYIKPVDVTELSIQEKEDFFQLLRKKRLSEFELQYASPDVRIVVIAEMLDGSYYPAFVSVKGESIIVDLDMLNEEEQAAYEKLLKNHVIQ